MPASPREGCGTIPARAGSSFDHRRPLQPDTGPPQPTREAGCTARACDDPGPPHRPTDAGTTWTRTTKPRPRRDQPHVQAKQVTYRASGPSRHDRSPPTRPAEQAEPTGIEPASSRFWRPRATTSALRPRPPATLRDTHTADPTQAGKQAPGFTTAPAATHSATASPDTIPASAGSSGRPGESSAQGQAGTGKTSADDSFRSHPRRVWTVAGTEARSCCQAGGQASQTWLSIAATKL